MLAGILAQEMRATGPLAPPFDQQVDRRNSPAATFSDARPSQPMPRGDVDAETVIGGRNSEAPHRRNGLSSNVHKAHGRRHAWGFMDG